MNTKLAKENFFLFCGNNCQFGVHVGVIGGFASFRPGRLGLVSIHFCGLNDIRGDFGTSL
ncbi:MAG: hypothetical protein ACYSR1_07400 [Planctomycetota bacterium]